MKWSSNIGSSNGMWQLVGYQWYLMNVFRSWSETKVLESGEEALFATSSALDDDPFDS